MKNIICLLGLFVASLSYATSDVEIVDDKQNYSAFESVICFNDQIEDEQPLGCTSSTTSTVTTNPDGSTTRTTTTTVDCDTPQELAQYHAIMAAFGMGV